GRLRAHPWGCLRQAMSLRSVRGYVTRQPIQCALWKWMGLGKRVVPPMNRSGSFPLIAHSFALLLFWSVGLSTSEARQPNVIVFLVDDMGWMDCGAYGSK